MFMFVYYILDSEVVSKTGEVAVVVGFLAQI